MESELIKLRLSEKKLQEALCRLFDLLNITLQFGTTSALTIRPKPR